MKSKILGLLAVGLLAGPMASAATYTFDVQYSGGGVAALSGGSDDPNSVNLAVGDSFDWTIRADGGEFWRVETTSGFFPLMGIATLDSGTRTGDFELNLLLNNSSVFNALESGAVNQFAHLGTNIINLVAGLEFDTMVLNFELVSSDSVNNQLFGLLPIFGAPEQNQFFPGIAYIEAVPEPGTLALLSLGLAGLGLSRRRVAH